MGCVDRVRLAKEFDVLPLTACRYDGSIDLGGDYVEEIHNAHAR